MYTAGTFGKPRHLKRLEELIRGDSAAICAGSIRTAPRGATMQKSEEDRDINVIIIIIIIILYTFHREVEIELGRNIS